MAPRVALGCAFAAFRLDLLACPVATATHESKKKAGVSLESVLLQVRTRNGTFLSASQLASETPIQGTLSLAHFQYKQQEQGCYDRVARGDHAVVDGHLHPRPRDGDEVPFMDLMGWLRDSGVLFTTVMGIGQRHKSDNWNVLEQTITNDLYNGYYVKTNRAILAAQGPHVMTSITFPELAEPERIREGWNSLQTQYPGVFGPMGEINLVKESLFAWGVGLPVPEEKIADWSWFMSELRKKSMPINLHCDLGTKESPWKYVALMDKVLSTYQSNKIVWAHLAGVSDTFAPSGSQVATHIQVIKARLDYYPNLVIDLAWDILHDYLFSDPSKRAQYVALFNSYPDRFIPGVDFVAGQNWGVTEALYREQLAKNSDVFKDLDDVAFRKIALGENYFELMALTEEFRAPQVCTGASSTQAAVAATAACVDDPTYTDKWGDCEDWSGWVKSGRYACEWYTDDCPDLTTKCPEACRLPDDPTYTDKWGDCAAWSRWVESGAYKCEWYTEDCCPDLTTKCPTACGPC